MVAVSKNNYCNCYSIVTGVSTDWCSNKLLNPSSVGGRIHDLPEQTFFNQRDAVDHDGVLELARKLGAIRRLRSVCVEL